MAYTVTKIWAFHTIFIATTPISAITLRLVYWNGLITSPPASAVPQAVYYPHSF